MRLLIYTILIAWFTLPANADALGTYRQNMLLAAQPIQGPVLTQADFEGKTVVVTFFASWCPPCVHEFKVLGKVRAAYDTNDVTLIAVNVFEKIGSGNEERRLKRFLSRSDPGIAVIEGSKAIRVAFGKVERIPTMVIHDRSGRESFRFVHERDAEIMSVDYDTLVGAIDKTGVPAIN